DVTLEMPVVVGGGYLPGSGGSGSRRRGAPQVFNSDSRLITFLHEGDQVRVRHAINVSGPRHDVEMNLCVRIGFDEQGKFATTDVEPADIGLFDYVVNSRLKRIGSV